MLNDNMKYLGYLAASSGEKANCNFKISDLTKIFLVFVNIFRVIFWNLIILTVNAFSVVYRVHCNILFLSADKIALSSVLF